MEIFSGVADQIIIKIGIGRIAEEIGIEKSNQKLSYEDCFNLQLFYNIFFK